MKPWAVVTGASSGIGRATALALSAKGWPVHLLARRRDRLEALGLEIKKAGGEVRVSELDVSDRSKVDHWAKTVSGDPISVLINNAGLAKGVDKVQSADPNDWDVMIDTNVKGLLYMTRALLPKMIDRREGHIVNLGSVAGRWTYPGGAVYCATKFAVRSLTEGLRMDLLGQPIRVTNIEPGMVETEFSEVRLGDKERAESVYKGMKPLSANDVADAILWSLERPAHVNVQELVLFPTDQAAIQTVHRHV